MNTLYNGMSQARPHLDELLTSLKATFLNSGHVGQFLAAMSSSRSDVVTQSIRTFVRVSVRSFVFPSVPFFSFSVLEVSSSPKEFKWCFKAV